MCTSQTQELHRYEEMMFVRVREREKRDAKLKKKKIILKRIAVCLN